MQVYFYCNTRLYGYMLREVDPATGMFLKNEKETSASMDKDMYNALIMSGAKLGLRCLGGGKMGFFAKSISVPDGNKITSVVFVSEGGNNKADDQTVRRLAALALFDHAKFCELIEGCITTILGEDGFELSGEKLGEIFDYAQKNLPAPKNEWDKQRTDIFRGELNFILENRTKEYIYLVVDTTLEYYNKMMNENMSQGKDIGYIYPKDKLVKGIDGLYSTEVRAQDITLNDCCPGFSKKTYKINRR